MENTQDIGQSSLKAKTICHVKVSVTRLKIIATGYVKNKT